jgi:cytoskeletal protein RodZ
VSELDTLAEVVAPEVALPMQVTKWVLRGIASLAVVGLIVFVIWKLFFAQHAAEQKSEIVQAKGAAAVSQAGAEAGKAAVTTVTNNYTYAAASDRKTQENRHAILQAPGASQPVDPALDALVRSDICMRTSAASLPECQRLQQPAP